MFDAQCITEPLHGSGAAPEIAEFVCAVQVGRIPDDMIMDMGFVHMGSDDKSMIAFQEARCKLIPNFVGFLRRYLSRSKGLAYLIGNHVSFLAAACTGLIFFFGQQKFSIHRSWVAGKCGNQLAAVGFFRIFHITIGKQ